jgi:hypothetical protein
MQIAHLARFNSNVSIHTAVRVRQYNQTEDVTSQSQNITGILPFTEPLSLKTQDINHSCKSQAEKPPQATPDAAYPPVGVFKQQA